MVRQIVEKFDGLRQNKTAEKIEYTCTYRTRGLVPASAFPASLRWECLGISNPFARLIGIGNFIQLGPHLFEVSCNYSTAPEDHQQKQQDKDAPKNPLLRPPVRSWDTGYIEIYSPVDFNNKPYANSAGQPYAGGLPLRMPFLVLRYTRNERYFPEALCLSTYHHVDSTKKVLCTKFSGSEEMVDNDVSFVKVSYEFWKFGPGDNKWETRKLDNGTYYLDEAGHKVFVTDKDGTKAAIDGAFFLNGMDGKLGNAADPRWNVFQDHQVTNFAALGLPGL